jgi:hypothetical protein
MNYYFRVLLLTKERLFVDSMEGKEAASEKISLVNKPLPKGPGKPEGL